MELATVAAGALLSASFEKLFDVLASPDVRHLVTKTELQSQLHNWELILPKIHAVLEDAQDKQSTTRLVSIWLGELRYLVYDVEDVLDEFATEALRLRLKDKHSRSKVKKILSSRYTCGRSSIRFVARMGSKLKEITGRLETICTQMTHLNLGVQALGGGRVRSENMTRTPTTSLPDTHFFGRDSDKKALLNMLLADGTAAVSVIPIQGMGGLGKTTLAQQLYNDANVKLHFDLRAWVCVSDTFDILSITRTILHSVGGETCEGMNLDQLQINLETTLSGRKFFIVLDDVWNEKYEDWTILSKPFRRGAFGSKIVVTTRSQKVAERTGTTQAHRLRELSWEDCLSIFSQHALGVSNFDGHPDLKDIGEKIVMKCKGLPLVAKTLGGLLRTNLHRDEWVHILKSPIWLLPDEESDILPALRLSYHHLPSQLKQCFAYCALFPKDYEFDIDELVLLWMAEGLLSHLKRWKNMEDVGVQYFYDLVSRSFFQPSSKDCGKFVMHDLIHDVAQVVAGDTCFHLDERKHLITLKTRHLSFIQRYREIPRRFEVFDEGKGLRTLLALTDQCYGHGFISVDVLDMMLSKLRNLRTLSLSGYKIREVPASVNGLNHLRYLNLSGTDIKLLPEFVCSLLNLQTLLLANCKQLEKLPSSIGNLPNLCHLDIHGTSNLKEMPAGIGNLTELRSLGKFIVGLGSVDGLNIRDLKNLSRLKGELSLDGLQNVEKPQDAKDADLKGKQDLRQLAMRWNWNLGDPIPNESEASKVLEVLQPHRNLKTLVIESYCALEFPTWFGDPVLMSNVVKIELSNCWKSTSLPSLWRLPVLKHLIIKEMKEIKTLGYDCLGNDNGGFQSLETLKLEDMQGLEKWHSCGAAAAARECVWKLPNLLELEILDCPVLVGECLVSLPSLCTLKLEECNESVLRCIIDMNSLTTLNIREISGLSCLHESVGQWLAGLEDLNISKCEQLSCLWQSEPQIEEITTCLRNLEVTSCPDLISFVNIRIIKKMTSLEKMIVKDCPRICSVQTDQQQDETIKSTWKLKHIELENCGNQFVECVINGVMLGGEESCLVDYLEIRRCNSLERLAIISKRRGNKVKELIIGNCGNLVSISNSYEGNIVEIEELRISDCPSLTTNGMKLLVAVKKLCLWICSQLESVAEESIISFDKNHNMSSTVVEEIRIHGCPNLKSLPYRLHELTNLTRLTLYECDGLEFFPERALHAPNLISLEIVGCRNLKSMPKNMQNLTSLERLVVRGCTGLKSFPEEGTLPPNLIHLDCPNVNRQMIETLTSLEELWIGGDSSVKEMLIPTTLKSLYIGDMEKLECISSSKCLHLQKNLPLTTLYIAYCPKLRYLPKEGLPHTLEELSIRKCPILENKCLKGKGKYWPLISLIPDIRDVQM